MKVWDVRQLLTPDIVGGRIHQLSFDRRYNHHAFDDAQARFLILKVGVFGVHAADLRGHEDAVQSVMFEPGGKYIMSGASDCTFRVWSMGA